MSGVADLVGRTLVERYRIDALLARGGMARVYRARDERLERDVAVKVLSAPYADDPAYTARFLEEARASASLSHPSLVHVYDSGSDDGAHFIVMELLDQHSSLREVLEQRGPLPPGEVVEIGRQLLAGLRVVHDHGLVHCDVKSANVMLGPGPAKLIDFGIATAPREAIAGETSIGSLHYMSPEQLHGEPLTPASDLYALGAVLYEALTGRPPFRGATPAEIGAAQRADLVAPPSSVRPEVPARLDAVVLQALRRDPAARFKSAEAMAVALESAAAGIGDESGSLPGPDDETQVVRTGYVPPRISAPTARPVSRVPGSPRRSRPPIPWSAIGTLLVLGAAALVVLFVVVPLLELGRGEGVASPTLGATAPASEQAGPTVVVPNFIGMPTAQAIEAAGNAGLEWTVRCEENQAQPAGIIDQEPPAGTEVRRGSTFTMYSARISDCR